MKEWIINSFTHRSVVKNQYQMAWSRLPFVFLCLVFVMFNHDDFRQQSTFFFGFTSLYLIVHILAAIRVEINPVSPWRTLGLVALDVVLVAVSMILDTGSDSGLFFFFFVIIFLSAYWFGTAMLICAQSIVLVGYVAVAAYAGIAEHEFSMFMLHLLELMVIPAFAVLLSNQSQVAQAEEASAEKNIFGMLDQGPLPVFTYHVDRAGVPRVSYVNHAAKDVYAGDTAFLIGNSVTGFAAAEDAEEMKLSCLHVFSEQHRDKPHSFFVRGQNEQGEMLQLMGLTAQVPWQGEWSGVCFLFDITQSENRRAQMNESLQEGYMSTLVAGIVHDFRNVLTSMIGTAEVMQFTTTDKAAYDQLGLIIDAGERGSDTITHLLKLGSSDNKESDADATMDDIEHTLNSIMELLRIQLPEHIQLVCTIDDGLPQIHFDITQLEQVLMNLVNNATQAIGTKGQILLHVSSDQKHHIAAADHPALKISIVDNGCGISAEDLPFITQNFWTSRKDSGGTGLGLAMVKRIINNHGGELEITSQVGVGTQVFVYLPGDSLGQEAVPLSAKVVGEAQIVAEHAPAPHGSNPLAASVNTALHDDNMKPCTILLVDDNPDVLMVHGMQLEAMGHHVVTASSGDEALATFEAKATEIQMLITDFKMPGMDGIDLATALRQKQPELPMLMVTAYGETDKLSRAKDLNIAMLLKPSTFQKFSQAITTIQKDYPAAF